MKRLCVYYRNADTGERGAIYFNRTAEDMLEFFDMVHKHGEVMVLPKDVSLDILESGDDYNEADFPQTRPSLQEEFVAQHGDVNDHHPNL